MVLSLICLFIGGAIGWAIAQEDTEILREENQALKDELKEKFIEVSCEVERLNRKTPLFDLTKDKSE